MSGSNTTTTSRRREQLSPSANQSNKSIVKPLEMSDSHIFQDEDDDPDNNNNPNGGSNNNSHSGTGGRKMYERLHLIDMATIAPLFLPMIYFAGGGFYQAFR